MAILEPRDLRYSPENKEWAVRYIGKYGNGVGYVHSSTFFDLWKNYGSDTKYIKVRGL